MLKVKVNSRNQIVIPAEARRKLGIKPGDELILDIYEGAMFVMREPDDHLEELKQIGKQLFPTEQSGQEWLQQERDTWKK